jgi:hypothetical protein
MPSTDTKPELTAKTSMAQPVSQPAVYANGLILTYVPSLWFSKYFLGLVSNIVEVGRPFKMKIYLKYKMNEN